MSVAINIIIFNKKLLDIKIKYHSRITKMHKLWMNSFYDQKKSAHTSWMQADEYTQ